MGHVHILSPEFMFEISYLPWYRLHLSNWVNVRTGLPLVFDTPNGEIVSGKVMDLYISRISPRYFRLTGQ